MDEKGGVFTEHTSSDANDSLAAGKYNRSRTVRLDPEARARGADGYWETALLPRSTHNEEKNEHGP